MYIYACLGKTLIYCTCGFTKPCVFFPFFVLGAWYVCEHRQDLYMDIDDGVMGMRRAEGKSSFANKILVKKRGEKEPAGKLFRVPCMCR